LLKSDTSTKLGGANKRLKAGWNLAYCPAVASDLESLIALRIESMRESLERIGRFDPERARARFCPGFSPEHTRHILVGGKRIGFFVVKPQAAELLLDHLYIHPSHQGRSVGGAVLVQVFIEADRSGGLPVRVGALRESESNRFYSKHGFQLVEQSEFDNYDVRSGKNAL
jgi:GNAT superfamily N-acetyltransferase